MNEEYMKEHNKRVLAQLQKQGPVPYEKRKKQILNQLKRNQPEKSSPQK